MDNLFDISFADLRKKKRSDLLWLANRTRLFLHFIEPDAFDYLIESADTAHMTASEFLAEIVNAVYKMNKVDHSSDKDDSLKFEDLSDDELPF